MLTFYQKAARVAAILWVASLFFFTIPHPVTAGNQVVINMTATIVKKTPEGKYIGGWDPKKITVKEGDEVLIHLKSLDAEHVFSLHEYNIEKDVSPGAPVDVRFIANKVGIFYYNCGMECGPLHKAMVGEFIVTKKE